MKYFILIILFLITQYDKNKINVTIDFSNSQIIIHPLKNKLYRFKNDTIFIDFRREIEDVIIKSMPMPELDLKDSKKVPLKSPSLIYFSNKSILKIWNYSKSDKFIFIDVFLKRKK